MADIEEDLLREEITALHEGIRKDEADVWKVRTLAFGFIVASITLGRPINSVMAAILAAVVFLYIQDVLFQDNIDRRIKRRDAVRDALLSHPHLKPFIAARKTRKLEKICKILIPGWYRAFWYGGMVILILWVAC